MNAPIIEGLFSVDAAEPALLGSRCSACGTYYFPKQSNYCRNPDCDSERFDEVPLSRSGTLWSFTNACYQPPAPYVAEEPFEPYAIAAVKLEREQMIVLGQVVGIHIDDSVIAHGKVDVTKLKPIARLGYGDYAVIDEVFELSRP